MIIKKEEKKKRRNKHYKSLIKNSLKTLVSLKNEKKEEVSSLVFLTQKILDRTASKGIIHKNKAKRLKSRIQKKLL